MVRNYEVVSPSLDGILRHESVVYAGIKRPLSIARIFDKLSRYHSVETGGITGGIEDRKVIEEYFHDLYGIFLKNLSRFAIESDPLPDESVKLQAMFQELVKVKKLLSGN